MPGRGARHHGGGASFRRRRGDGGRPSRHRGQHHRPPRHGEGLSRRPALGRRHRRGGRTGGGDGQALPDPARALREGRGRGPQPRGQGQPAGPDGARAPPHGHAGPRGGAAVLRLRPARRRGADLHLRRHRRALRRGRPRRHRIGRARRPDHHQARVARRPRTRRQRRAGRAGPVRGGRRGLRHRRARPGAGDLPRGGDGHGPGLRTSGRRRGGRTASRPWSSGAASVAASRGGGP